MPVDNNFLFNFISKLLKQSSKIANDLYNQNNTFEIKKDLSPVTKADKKIEEFLIKAINKSFPNDSILCEEHKNQSKKSNAIWTIDPIDGTKAFICEIPTWASIISYSIDSKFILSALSFPALSQTYIAIKDYGFFINDQPFINQSSSGSIANSQIGQNEASKNLPNRFIVATGSIDHFGRKLADFNKIKAQATFTIYGCDAYLYCKLAKGSIDLICDCDLKVYDYAPLITMLEMSGCIISDWQGNDLTHKSKGQIIAARSKDLQKFALSHLSS